MVVIPLGQNSLIKQFGAGDPFRSPLHCHNNFVAIKMTVSVTIYTLKCVPGEIHRAFVLAHQCMMACRLCLDHGQVLVDTVFTQGQQIYSTTALSFRWRLTTYVFLCFVP